MLAEPNTCKSVMFLNKRRSSPFEYCGLSSGAHQHSLRDLRDLILPNNAESHCFFPDFWLMEDANTFSIFRMICDTFVWFKAHCEQLAGIGEVGP